VARESLMARVWRYGRPHSKKGAKSNMGTLGPWLDCEVTKQSSEKTAT